MIKIFGHPASTCTRKVLMTLAETNTPFELTIIDFAKAEHEQQPHLSRQPFGQIPAIDDDGFSLYESRAICRYINEKAGGKLAPSDLEGRALMEQWISIETANFAPHVMKFIGNDVFKHPQEPATLEAAGKGVEAAPHSDGRDARQDAVPRRHRLRPRRRRLHALPRVRHGDARQRDAR
jgi:glutathione S-transferase